MLPQTASALVIVKLRPRNRLTNVVNLYSYRLKIDNITNSFPCFGNDLIAPLPSNLVFLTASVLCFFLFYIFLHNLIQSSVCVCVCVLSQSTTAIRARLIRAGRARMMMMMMLQFYDRRPTVHHSRQALSETRIYRFKAHFSPHLTEQKPHGNAYNSNQLTSIIQVLFEKSCHLSVSQWARAHLCVCARWKVAFLRLTCRWQTNKLSPKTQNW